MSDYSHGVVPDDHPVKRKREAVRTGRLADAVDDPT
jgi:hypothetical protein